MYGRNGGGTSAKGLQGKKHGQILPDKIRYVSQVKSARDFLLTVAVRYLCLKDVIPFGSYRSIGREDVGSERSINYLYSC